nr:hypothetical protein Iba_chr15bCG1100 [Ipomoea batatas]
MNTLVKMKELQLLEQNLARFKTMKPALSSDKSQKNLTKSSFSSS